jgi:hypothetical protein
MAIKLTKKSAGSYSYNVNDVQYIFDYYMDSWVLHSKDDTDLEPRSFVKLSSAKEYLQNWVA